MAAPAMVAALAVARKGAAKIAGGKTGDVVGQAELFHRALEGVHALADFGEQVGVRADGGAAGAGRLAGVQIVAADRAEKNLALHAEAAGEGAAISGFDHPRDHLELRTEAGGEGVWRRRGRDGDGAGERRDPIIRGGRGGDGVVQQRPGLNAVLCDFGIRLRLQVRVGQSKDVGQRGLSRAADAGERNRAGGGDGVLRDDVADFKRVCAGKRHGK